MGYNDNLPDGNARFLGLLIKEVENFPYPSGVEAESIAAGDLKSAELDKDPFEQGDREILGQKAIKKLLLLQNLAQMGLVTHLDELSDSQYRHHVGLSNNAYQKLMVESWREALRASALEQLEPPNPESNRFLIGEDFIGGLQHSQRQPVKKLSGPLKEQKLDPSKEFESLLGLYVKDYEREFHQHMQECWDEARKKHQSRDRGGGPAL